MKEGDETSEFSPIPFYLENNKIADLVRVMFNCNLSEQYLIRYGQKKECFSSAKENIKINNFTKFDVKDVIFSE